MYSLIDVVPLRKSPRCRPAHHEQAVAHTWQPQLAHWRAGFDEGRRQYTCRRSRVRPTYPPNVSYRREAGLRDWEVVRPLLRTCYEHPEAFRNCSDCLNCRRTMMVLAAIGVLGEYKTFGRPSRPDKRAGQAKEVDRSARAGNRRGGVHLACNPRQQIGATSPIAMVVVQEPTIGRKLIFFLARNHFFNLVRKPGRVAIV
jgi:hypothetical protein